LLEINFAMLDNNNVRAAVLCTAGFKNRPLLLSSIACNAEGLRTDVRAAANYYKAIKNRQQSF
jgi:hypothetical protein